MAIVEHEQNHKLEMRLVAMLARTFPGMTVDVRHSRRWNRMCVTFRWPGFADLLPEERFHRLVSVIPGTFRNRQLGGLVWLELVPAETVEEFLKLPRSEDVAGKEESIYVDLDQVGFFEALRHSLGSAPQESCPGDLSSAVEVLLARGYSQSKIREAKLLFIRHGVYCDCQVLQSVQQALAQSRQVGTGAA